MIDNPDDLVAIGVSGELDSEFVKTVLEYRKLADHKVYKEILALMTKRFGNRPTEEAMATFCMAFGSIIGQLSKDERQMFLFINAVSLLITNSAHITFNREKKRMS